MQAAGYFLFFPPDPIKSRFVMLDEVTMTFHDVDLGTPLLGNPSSWNQTGVSPSILGRSLAIVFTNPLDESRQTELREHGFDPDFQVGKLISIDHREGKEVHGTIIAMVNVKPFPENLMSWELLDRMKELVLPQEIRNGLCGRLWGRPDARQGFVTSRNILDGMSRQWHVDPAALNYELDGIFAAGELAQLGDVTWLLKKS